MISYLKIYFYSYISFLSVIPQTYSYFRFGLPPEYRKRGFIKKIIQNINFDNAIETGTYLGQTTKILKKYIPNVYSIEIKRDLYLFAKKKYRKTNINFIYGDSAENLENLLKKLRGPTLFFLDGHASGGITSRGKFVTSLRHEIKILEDYKNIKDSLVLIDDAMSLNGTNDYPNIKDLEVFAFKNNLKIYKTKLNSYVITDEKICDVHKVLSEYIDQS